MNGDIGRPSAKGTDEMVDPEAPPDWVDGAVPSYTFGVSRPLALLHYEPDPGRERPEYCADPDALLKELDARVRDDANNGGPCQAMLLDEPFTRLRLECLVEAREKSITLYSGEIWGELVDGFFGDGEREYRLRGHATVMNAKGRDAYEASHDQKRRAWMSSSFQEVLDACR